MEELALHLLDLLENSLEAGASEVKLLINEEKANNLLILEVKDNGRGMTSEMAHMATSPFITTRKTRRIGLGLSLLKATVESCGGEMLVISELGKGTKVKAQMPYVHWDRPPLGDIASTIVVFLTSSKEISLNYTHLVNERIFTFSSQDFSKLLDDVPLSHPQILDWLKNYLRESLRNIS